MYCFISPRYRRNTKLALFTFLFAFVVITLGAYTRLTNAGLSCPDWPHCFGYLTAPHTLVQIENAVKIYPQVPVDISKAWTEMGHRYAAGAEGILMMTLALSILLSRKAKGTKAIALASALIFLLLVQILLGMFTVTEKLKPVIVLSHLLTGISILSVLWWIYLEVHLRDDAPFATLSNPRIIYWAWPALAFVAIQITLGGWVSTHSAGLACIDLPYCNGKLMPTIQWREFNHDLVTIHMLHRMGAIITAMYLTVFTCVLLRKKQFRLMAVCIFGLLLLQVALGVLNIIWLRPLWIAMIHQAVGIVLLLSIITSIVKASFHGKPLYDNRIA